MSIVKVVRVPRVSATLMPTVNGEPLQGVSKVEVISVAKNLTRLRVEFVAFELLGETFPVSTLIDPEKARVAAEIAAAQGLTSTLPPGGTVFLPIPPSQEP